MALPFQRLSLHATTFYSTVVVVFAAQVAIIVIVILLATSKGVASRPISAIAIGAAVLDVCSVVSTVAGTVLYLRRVAKKILALCCGLMIIAAVPAALLTIYAVVRIRTGFHDNRPTGTIQPLTLAGIVIWVVSTVGQIVFYTIVLWPDSKREHHVEGEEFSQKSLQMQSVEKPLPMHLIILTSQQNSHSRTGKVSTAITTRQSSFRQSIHQAIKPVTSKSRLIRDQSFNSRDSLSAKSIRETRSVELRRDDDFESWDTSGVEDTMETIYTTRTRKIRLETIPGSRPVSPAKPLDGPFKQEQPSGNKLLPSSPSITLPDLPSPTLSPAAADADFHRSFSAPSSRWTGKAGRTHIHPLFRNESPAPLPLASPGTVITASPYAGQVVSHEQAFHSSSRRLHSAHSGRADSMDPDPSRQVSWAV